MLAGSIGIGPENYWSKEPQSLSAVRLVQEMRLNIFIVEETKYTRIVSIVDTLMFTRKKNVHFADESC